MEPSSDRGTEPVLGEGHYTVVLAGAGHRTLEVTRAGPDFRAGPFIVSYLSGPDNERDYRAFAHITPAGDGRLWHRFREDSALAAALAAMVANPTGAATDLDERGPRAPARAPVRHGLGSDLHLGPHVNLPPRLRIGRT